jgi:hypothetical protein
VHAALLILLLSQTAEPAMPAERLRLGLRAGEPISATASWAIDRLVLQAELGPSTDADQAAIAALDLTYWLPEMLGDLPSGDRIVPWFGGGARLSFGKAGAPDRFGGRIPIGASYVPADGAIELFLSIAPGVTFLPDVLASLDFGLGVRVAF